MKIIFRVDAYPEIGMGHIVRSSWIASSLLSKKKDYDIIFAGRFDSDISCKLEINDFSIIHKEKNKDEYDFLKDVITKTSSTLVFIDNLFPYSYEFISDIKKITKVILFHNPCEGRFAANSYILPSAHHSEDFISDPEWKKHSVNFHHGLKYIPINEDIAYIKKKRKKQSNRNTDILITTGGSDPKGVMIKILEYLKDSSFSKIKIKALVGNSFIHNNKLEILKPVLPDNIEITNFSYHHFLDCKKVIATFGVTSYELLFLGIPFISVSHAKNNALGSKILSKKIPFIYDLGLIDNIDQALFLQTFHDFVMNHDIVHEFKKIANHLMDDQGIPRITNIIHHQIERNE